eukprot:SAG25_NODE_14750_length_251_cov_0.901316_1_plen_31_part_10
MQPVEKHMSQIRTLLHACVLLWLLCKSSDRF